MIPQPVYSELPTLWRAKLLLKKKISESDYTANYRVRGVWNIKNIIDDRIKLLTVIDTITKENRTMYRHIQNSSKSWFSRIFN
jgi:hypothetical protein